LKKKHLALLRIINHVEYEVGEKRDQIGYALSGIYSELYVITRITNDEIKTMRDNIAKELCDLLETNIPKEKVWEEFQEKDLHK
jgi:hypothetical protein